MERVKEALPIGMPKRLALGVGAAGLVLLFASGLLGTPGVFQSYLFAYTWWFALSVGAVGGLLLHHLLKSFWGRPIAPFMEASALALPLLAGLFVPVLFGLQELYPWARPEVVAEDPILQHKAVYLNPGFFALRFALYFALWIGITVLLVRLGRAHEPSRVQRRTELSAAGMVLFVFSASFAAVDLLMSLEPHFFSASFGAIFVEGHVLTALAAAVVGAVLLAPKLPGLKQQLTPTNLQNLTNLLLVFLTVWAYLAFAQYLIIWGANLPAEAIYFVERSQGPWRGVSLALMGLQFALPFLLLLTNPPKRTPWILGAVAAWLVLMRLVDVAWTVVPSLDRAAALAWTDLLAFLGVGGLWVWWFLGQLEERIKAHALQDVPAERGPQA